MASKGFSPFQTRIRVNHKDKEDKRTLVISRGDFVLQYMEPSQHNANVAKIVEARKLASLGSPEARRLVDALDEVNAAVASLIDAGGTK